VIDAVDRLDREAFVARFGGVFEDSPWIAREAWEARPFDSVDALHAAMVRVVEHSPAAAMIESGVCSRAQITNGKPKRSR